LPALAAAHRITSPALLVIGQVATMADELGWFGEVVDTTDGCASLVFARHSSESWNPAPLRGNRGTGSQLSLG